MERMRAGGVVPPPGVPAGPSHRSANVGLAIDIEPDGPADSALARFTALLGAALGIIDLDARVNPSTRSVS
jgi:hypothetical protein